MPIETQTDFIVIDDDPINNLIFTKMITIAIPGTLVNAFTEPLTGLEYIKSVVADYSSKKLIIFLDIVMPLMNCWDVLDNLKIFGGLPGKNVMIYLISPLIGLVDNEKAKNNEMIAGYVSKPLTIAKLQQILSGNNKQYATLD